MRLSISGKQALIMALLCVLTFLSFRYTLNNQFTNWDDDYYVTNDRYIKALTADNLKVIFTEDITKNNYHPFCMLSLAINYHFAQLSPMSYYLTNILIHIANVLLVFFLFMGLCRRLQLSEQGRLLIAGFGAAWFGVHPMHVESVAWIAERKDVLYGFFYIFGLLAWLRYRDANQKKWFWITFALFVASCLSKPMAVVFPLSLLCVDLLLYKGEGQTLVQDARRALLEKAVFFAGSLAFGLAAVYTQNKTGAIAKFDTLTLAERFMYAAYGFIMYVSKFFNPAYLSTFYPYPFRYLNYDDPSQPGRLHAIFYAAPFIALAILLVPAWLAWRYNKKYFRIVVFGIGFLLVNLIFVLQFLSVGAAIMADRYSYVAYIGLIFVVCWLLYGVITRWPGVRTGVLIALVAFTGALSWLCYERTFVWHDAYTLLTDAVEKYPFKKDPDKHYDSKNSGIAFLSYKWLGNYWFDKGNLDKALEQYMLLQQLHAADDKVEAKIAHINALKGGEVPGLTGAGEATQPGAQHPGQAQPYLDSSYNYARSGDSLKALRTYILAYRYNPAGVEKVYAAHAFACVQQGKFDEAINEYGVLLKLNASNAFYYFYRGVSKFSKGNMKDAITDWETSLLYPSKDVEQSASYNLGVAYDSLGKADLAWNYISRAKKAGYEVNPDFEAKIKRKFSGVKQK
jgi:tetratricopeptide (TPR) repeat protein